MRRRTALKTLGTLAGAAAGSKFLSACSSNPGEPEGITNIVVLMMENRSYDHYLGARAHEGLGGRGFPQDLAYPNISGSNISVFRTQEQCAVDPPHGWGAAHRQWNNGANDGFLTEHEQDHGAGFNDAISYMLRDDVPVHWAMADQFTSCDAWFSSLMGPTWPNRMYWHSGQSNGVKANDFPTDGFRWDTIYHRLDEKGIDWAYYYGDIPVLGIIEDFDLVGRVRRVLYDFIDDATAGRLPPVVYLDPFFSSNDDHPPHHPLLGQQYISMIYNVLANSPQWKNTMFVVTYDENGGYFDHVAPPTTQDDYAAQGFGQLGFRVPTVVAGPYVKEGYVSSTVYDHTSVLKHIENMFGLDPLTARSTAANDLTDCIDMDRLAAADWREAPPMPAIEIDEATLPSKCKYAPSFAPGPVEQWADFKNFGRDVDLRWMADDVPYMVGEILDKYNAGRIKRS